MAACAHAEDIDAVRGGLCGKCPREALSAPTLTISEASLPGSR